MKPPQIPDDHYVGLGKVTVAASKLEVMIGQVAVGVLDPAHGVRFGEFASRPGLALRKLAEACACCPDDLDLSQLRDDAEALLRERNKYVHAIVFIDYAPAHDTPGPAWVLHRPWDGSDLPMPSLAELEALADRMNAVSARSLGVAMNAIARRQAEADSAADSVRTDDG